MERNLMTKTGVILVVVLGCLFGIIGFPKFVGGVGIPTSVAQLKANLAHNIKLGLDLKGGSHLVLQVQVQDAAKTEADQTIESLRDATKTAGISVAGLRPERSANPGRYRFHPDQPSWRRCDEDPGIPQSGSRQVSGLDSHASQRDRLQDEHEAERAGRSQAQHGGAGAGYDRAPRQRARVDRADRAGLWRVGQEIGDSGGAAGHRRSGACEGIHRLGGAAQDCGSEGPRLVEEPRRSAGREGRHSAARHASW